MSASSHSGISSIFPIAIFVQGNDQQTLSLNHTPYTVGRKVDRDLVIADPRVSREHASIVSENGEFFVVDLGSKHGTFVNGEKVDRHKLQRNDRLEFGARDVAYMIFHPLHTTSNTAREFLSQISGIQIAPEASDLEKLTLFMEAARKLNTIGVLDEILVTLLDATLKLTRAERGYIFLRDNEGTLTLAAGRNSKGEPLLDDKTISRSVLEGALTSNSEYLVTDTSQMLDVKERQSIVAFDLRTVICMPLRKPIVQTSRADQPAGGEVMGALYVDSRFASRDITSVSHDILRAIATEAAQLVENARLVQAEEAGRRYQQELSIAANNKIQITFSPHLLPVNRGILSTIYFTTNKSAAECLDIVKAAYANEPFVRMRKPDDLPNLRDVVYTNYCDITFTGGKDGQPVIAVSALDNIMKGASGQALQNMNIMFGIPETTGLLK